MKWYLFGSKYITQSQKMNNSFVYSIAYIQKHSEYFKAQKILNFPEFGGSIYANLEHET